MRIAASSTTTSTAALLTPASANPSGNTFQAALANSSDRANADNNSMSAGSKAHSGTSASSRSASKPEKAQPLSNDTATATSPVPPIDQKTASTGTLVDQESGARSSDSSSKTIAEAPDFRVAGSSPDPSPQMPVAQPNKDSSDQASTAQLPLATSPDKSVDATVEAKALIAPVELGAAAMSNAVAQASTATAAQSGAETFNLQMVPPATAILPNKGDSIESAGKTVQKNTADSASPKNSDPANATDGAKTKPTDAVGAASDGASHNAQSNGQPTQHSQPDSSQPIVAMPKIVDSAAAQAQPVPTFAGSHDASTTTGPIQSGSHQHLETSDTSSSALDGDEVTAATGINAAKLVQTMNETEMRVGLQSSEFGAISIRTSVSQQQMLAQISLDHTGLSQAISAHVASMQTKLGNDYGLNTLIQVNHQGASMAGQGSSQQREPRAFAPSLPVEGAAVPVDPDVGISPAALAGTSVGYRLDIRA